MLTTVLTPQCMECGARSVVTLPTVAVAAWQAGLPAQHAFPDMSAADREVLISGTHPACWDSLFSPSGPLFGPDRESSGR